MLTDFYTAFSALCFTLLGLWLVMVQTRLSEWRASPALQRRAYGWPGISRAHCRRPAGAAGHSFPRLRELRMIWVTRYLLRPSFWAISPGLSPCSL